MQLKIVEISQYLKKGENCLGENTTLHFSVFFRKGGDRIYLCIVSNFKKCQKQILVEKFPVTKHGG